jgi:predicted porin
MKKTLVALAALAATGAFAQVSITGELAMGYLASTTNGADKSGLGTDTSEIFFNASEDLGGGMKIDAKMEIWGADRSNEGGSAVVGGNAILGLTTGFGKVSLGSTKGADYLSGGISGVAGLSMDGKVFSARTSNDYIDLAVPLSSALVLSLNHKESATGLGLGVGTGGDAAVVGQRTDSVSLTYSSGALVANGNYVSYDNKDKTSATSKDSVLRAAVSYDLGVAKLGAGYSQTSMAANYSVKDALLGVSVPMGALTLRAQVATRDTENSGVVNGQAIGLTYALSKRTSVIAHYKRWDVLTNTKGADTQTAVLLDHTF